MSDLTDLLADAGVTYRQFDHWCRRGFIPEPPATDDADAKPGLTHPGSGFWRELQPAQVEHLRVMARLVHDGMRPDAASVLATLLIAGETATLGGYVLAPVSEAS